MSEVAERRRPRRLFVWTAVAGSALLATSAAVASCGAWYEPRLIVRSAPTPAERPAAAKIGPAFADLAPRGVYLVVDTYRNRLRVYRDGELLREAVCSTGSGIELREPGGRRWIFDTPVGERRVMRKVRDPVWVKPDWAFVELGFQPPEEVGQRIDRVSLGRYGLYLGDGYIIHGTLFQTLLGRRLTHGCVRLGDEDLEYVYRRTPIGAPVFLF